MRKTIAFCHRAGAILTLLLYAIHLNVSGQSATNSSPFPLEKGFASPPDSIQTSIYWYWISDNISKEGVEKDLEAMKRIGINRAFIGNIGLSENESRYGKVKIFTNEWWEILHAALKKATELNIEIGIFNSPGWSQSGGPWVKPEQAMRYLSSTKTIIQGGNTIQRQLPAPEGFQDVKVIAFPAPAGYGNTINDLEPVITTMPQIPNSAILFDKNTENDIPVARGAKLSIDLKCTDPYTARNIVIYPAHRNMKVEVELQAGQGDAYQTIKKFTVDRSNNELHVGWEKYAPVSESFAAVSSDAFRIIITHQSGDAGIAEIELSSVPRVERYVEKTLAKMFPTPLPYWKEYQWPQQARVTEKELLINPANVIDLTACMNKEGQLNWAAPKGQWIVLRTGMLPTGVTNSPASKEGTGLEIDKMSSRHAAAHFDAYMGEILRRIPEEDRRTWKLIVEDSYETGGQNWTDDFVWRFKSQYGYDPVPYIPAMYGNVVGSQDQSDRFLWDLRRFVADNVAYEYVGGLRKVSHQHGLKTWLENYGHWGFPGEFLQYGGQSDEIGGEFWSEGDLGNIENRAASSSAHIYGKRKVSAESFTAAGKTFARYPALMKQRGDRFFTEGINNTLLHVYIHQPYEDKRPGVNAWFGNEFNRFNTWYDDMDMFIAYLKRCNFMLQQGTYVADVAYFIGEDAPKMTGITDPPLPKGYSFDYINAEVIETRLSVKDGRFVLPDGLSYKILVLPKLETMRPELLKKITELVKQGGVVLGPGPERSPSLQRYGAADQEVQEMTALLWGNIDGVTNKMNPVGKGMVMNGMDMQEALDFLHVIPDFKTAEDDPVLFIHRALDEGDLYFISNQSDKRVELSPAFRITGKQPEQWNAMNGAIRDLPSYTVYEQATVIPLALEGYESMFILFRKDMDGSQQNNTFENFPSPQKSVTVTGPWKVQFDPAARGPVNPVVFNQLSDWSTHINDSIQYYSGTAYYTNTFKIKKSKAGERVVLDLGKITAMAKVKVNGREAGGVWTAPYSVDITDVVHKGRNSLEIKVVNTWVNRLIGDQQLREDERKTWTIINPYKADSPLQASGLLGPVTLQYIGNR
ncbi:MAG: glycoside hydrolase family 2 [Chitinophagaceae bacterium]|nr:glycoside hydrolase family 2 [Chitinophagaceae bacterium]